MTEGYYMTDKELYRIEVLLKVETKRLTRKQAAEELGLSEREIYRLLKRFKEKGPKGLASKKRGKPSNNQLSPNIKARIKELITCESYVGFRPTFMSEKLEEIHGITASRETVRQIMIESGLWIPRGRKRITLHQQRERRPRFGELVQIDASPHKWFEDRGDRCALIVMIDDATGRIYCRFAAVETTEAYMRATQAYIKKHGRPLALYSDRHSIFRINHPNCMKQEQLTQFGRAMKELDIGLICANSPQAKGRVERVNETLQDRLIKELRLKGINTIEEANDYLETIFIEQFNQRFSIEPASPQNAHRSIPKGIDLNNIFCEKHTRTLTKNLELQFETKVYQVNLESPSYRLKKAKVTVMKSLEGKISVEYQGKSLPIREFYSQSCSGQVVDPNEIDQFLRPKKPRKVSPYHPWLQEGRAEARRRAYMAL